MIASLMLVTIALLVANRFFVRDATGRRGRRVAPGVDRVTYYLAGSVCVVAAVTLAFDLPHATSTYGPIALVLSLAHVLVANATAARVDRANGQGLHGG